METETLEIDDELHHLPPEDKVEDIPVRIQFMWF